MREGKAERQELRLSAPGGSKRIRLRCILSYSACQQLSTLVTIVSIRFEDPGGDDQALNLAGALVDFGDAGVAIIPFDGIFAAVTVATVNLNRFVCDARGHFARK